MIKKTAFIFIFFAIVSVISFFIYRGIKKNYLKHSRINKPHKTALVQEKNVISVKDVKKPIDEIFPSSLPDCAYEISRYKFRNMPEVPESLIFIINENNDFMKRLKLLNELPDKLSSKEIEALYWMLYNGKNDVDGYVIKNDILNVLRNQNIPPSELDNIMLEIFYDKKQDLVLRTYVLQHMRPWYEERKTSRQDDFRRAFYDALKERDNGIAGTALLALLRLSDRFESEFDKNLIKKSALEILSDERSHVLSRITASQICGKMKINDSLPFLREIIEDGNTGISLKLASIASLGDIGDQSDIEVLDKVVKNDNKVFHLAARNSKQKLMNKNKF